MAARMLLGKLLSAAMVLSITNCRALRVNIDYSFFLPAELGVATLGSANCCPYGVLPDNVTNGLIPPMIYGIGTQKGGTTSLYRYLHDHPLIQSDAKEMHYLDNFNLTRDSYPRYLKRWAWNSRNGPSIINEKTGTVEGVQWPTNGSLLFEVSPSYMLIPFAACRAKHLTPSAKFIVLLREPADRAYSGFNHVVHYNRKIPEEDFPEWAKKNFLETVQDGIRHIDDDPECDLRSGHGKKTFNDCFGCMMMLGPRRPECDHQTFVQAIDHNMGYSCSVLSKELLLRGFYAAQIAWWFTLFPPEQFKVMNSEDFFKDTESMLAEIVDFLGFDQRYTSELIIEGRKKNGGIYKDTFALQSEVAKKLLREFYLRPNLELYRLLSENGEPGFTPFEKYLRKLDYLDCLLPSNIKTGLCGRGITESATDVEDSQTKTEVMPENSTNTISSGDYSTRSTLGRKWSPFLASSDSLFELFLSFVVVFSSLCGLKFIYSQMSKSSIPNRKHDL